MDKLPTLIQRVTRRSDVSISSKGIDSIFSFDYMGSSEFEWGAIPKALKTMRAARSESWRVRPIMALSKNGYYVGDPKTFNAAIQLFEDQLKPRAERQHHTKEWTYIYEMYFPHPRNRLGPFHAWWAIDWEIPFLLFKETEHAEEWMKLL